MATLAELLDAWEDAGEFPDAICGWQTALERCFSFLVFLVSLLRDLFRLCRARTGGL